MLWLFTVIVVILLLKNLYFLLFLLLFWVGMLDCRLLFALVSWIRSRMASVGKEVRMRLSLLLFAILPSSVTILITRAVSSMRDADAGAINMKHHSM